MDLIGSLISFLSGLLASSLIIINLVISSGYAIVSSFGVPESPAAHISVTVPSPTAATSTKETPAPAATTTAAVVKKKVPVPVPVSTTPTIPTSNTPLPPLISSDAINTNTRGAIVNILCAAAVDTKLRSISGSGVVVDSRGVILTNAHIGQYLLLRDAFHKDSVDCTVRIGSPASAQYRATLLYLPPRWIDANASQITAEHGVGTGEYDYAFLLINSSTNPAGTLPASFPYIGMSNATPNTGDGVLVAGYPAGFLDGVTIERSLYATSAFTTIGKLYTFNSTSEVDVVSLGGTVVAQGGSSGGAVVRIYDGKLAGLIATATVGTTTADRDLRAITIDYINRSLIAENKGGISGFLSNNLAKMAEEFNATTAPQERQKLIDAAK